MGQRNIWKIRKPCQQEVFRAECRLRRFAIRSYTIFPMDDSIRKTIYLSMKEIAKRWTMPVRDWGLAYAQFAIFFEERFAA